MNPMPRTPLIERRSPGQRPKLGAHKPKAWSHQDDLKALVGKRMRVTRIDGYTIIGTLVSADQFTLCLTLESQSLVTYFKHALVSYQPEA